MEIDEQHNADLAKVAEMVGDVRFAMLMTKEKDGAFRSRPMATMQLDSEGHLWFFTSLSSPKIEEAQSNQQVNLFYARGEFRTFGKTGADADCAARYGDSAAMMNRPVVALAALVNRLASKVFSRGYVSNPIETGKRSLTCYKALWLPLHTPRFQVELCNSSVREGQNW